MIRQHDLRKKKKIFNYDLNLHNHAFIMIMTGSVFGRKFTMNESAVIPKLSELKMNIRKDVLNCFLDGKSHDVNEIAAAVAGRPFTNTYCSRRTVVPARFGLPM